MISVGKRVAIVTGASRGIGRAVAERLAKDGFAVIVNYTESKSAAEDVAKEIIDSGAMAKAFRADVSEPNQVTAMFDFAEDEFGRSDIAVNCAGIMMLKPLSEFDIADFDRMHAINVRGTFLVSQQAAKRLQNGGAIINISTSAERQALPGYGPYAMTKGAVEALNLVLARELKGRDITVNSVGPGPTATELFLKDKSEGLIAAIGSLNPFNRIGQPQEIAEVVSFLAGPARWVNGQAIYVNGGMN
ncbi:SDR family oxidoreductase [Pantoea cypripedii]|uniref:3-ketoacyl-ACP reductase n=1 Tax=Pantoea cypripedii TaxID=55209 RepID=A0A6B9GGC9_PANCY|nr:SDR family oxidoreductase [Pantoea cypripedii]QGY32929.1 3-ketoacyl-ACP reductase [Pantoea cypripedii]